ncbi:TCP-1/cpn60 chaperonin [Gracilaria domingensis]|nr:TCP-1/cpn60 chaperonin [Gracilaria domingensis]
MLKMILDAMGNIVLTNDGNAILREIDVSHPAAKSMIELSRTQDEEVGDGTTSVTVLAGEILNICETFLQRNLHPTVIVSALFKALDDAVEFAEEMSVAVDVNDDEQVLQLIRSCIGTKYVTRHDNLIVGIAFNAVKTVRVNVDGRMIMDIKNFAKVEKIAGGELTDSAVLDGVMFNKDVTSAKMRRRIENPRIVLLDCPLEYRKAESQTNVEITQENDWKRLLEIEEEYVMNLCKKLLEHKPDLVITEKGASDLALHILGRKGVSVIRRLRKSDNNRIAKACGATVVSRIEELKKADVGTGAGLFEIKKIGDEYYSFITGCKDPKACTILLRGGSKDVLMEVERNLEDAMAVARNIFLNSKMVPGGGAIEMAVANRLQAKSKTITGVSQYPYRAVAEALEVIPRTLIENCGGNVIRVLTALRAKHNETEGEESKFWGIDGMKGVATDMRNLGIWEPLVVKTQTMKTAVEAAAMLLRIDDIVSGLSKKKDNSSYHAPETDE